MVLIYIKYRNSRTDCLVTYSHIVYTTVYCTTTTFIYVLLLLLL